MVLLTMKSTQRVLEYGRTHYGDAFTVAIMGGKKFVMLSDPAAVEEVFTSPPDVLIGDSGISVVVGNNSVITTTGPAHEAARTLLRPLFGSSQLDRYVPIIDERLAAEVALWPIRAPFQLLPRFEDLTRGVIMRAVFGTGDLDAVARVDARFLEFLAFRETTLGQLMLNIAKPGATPPKKFRELRAAFDNEVYAQIATARADAGLAERADMLAALVRAESAAGEPLSDETVRDHVTTMLIQGHASTATTLAWLFERVVRHPAVLQGLVEEAKDSGHVYLDAVLTETLRLRHPSSPIVVREVAKRCTVAGYELEPGTFVAAHAYALHRRPDLYPQPNEFRPERWLEATPGVYQWVAFGGGARHCIGRSFATLQITRVVQELLRRFEFQTTDAPDEKSRRRGIAWVPDDGATVTIARSTRE